MSRLTVANIHFNTTGSERIDFVNGNVNVITSGSFLVNGSAPASGGGGGFLSNVQTISSNTTAVKNTLYVLTAHSIHLTLPASPANTDLVAVTNMSNSINCVISRNNEKIMGLAENMNVDSVGASFTMVFSGNSYGWIVF